jgi:Fe-S oxidoreductase
MSIKDKIISDMPKLIWLLKIVAPLFNTVKKIPLLDKVIELFGFSSKRQMPVVQNIVPLQEIYKTQNKFKNKVILLADTFNINFEIKNLMYAIKVLNKFGYEAIIPSFDDANLTRPLCCGRTYISYGQMDKAKFEMNRVTNYLYENGYAEMPVVGIEPSCLLTFNDEYKSIKGIEHRDKLKNKFYLLEEFILEQIKSGNSAKSHDYKHNVLVHGHCHQKSQDRFKGLLELLATLNIKHKAIDSSCCGMAGSFGYSSKYYDISKKMANLSLIPTINEHPEDVVVANGTSCRQQIFDFSKRDAKHVSELLFNIFERVN